jgi:hypothetical protein
MKKIVFLAIFVTAFCLFSCEEYYRTKQVINNSDYEVAFIFNHFQEIEYTLKPHTSDYYTEGASIKSYSATPPRVSYTHDYKSRVTEFFNTPARQVKIINELDKVILMTAQGCMDNEPITILGNSELTVNIYTAKPEFYGITAIEKFPVKFTVSTNNQAVLVHW